MTIEAGEGYRLLEADETIREGDEWVWDPRIGFDWQPESHSVGSTVATERARVAQIRAEEGPPLRGATLLYRRRVSPLVEVHTVPESAYVVVIGEALIRVWPSEPRDWVRKVEAVGGEMAALRRETQALRDQVRCVGPETCGECLACVRSALTACRRERDDAQANVDALDEEIVAACAVLPSSDQPESLADRCARVVRERDEARALLEVANRGTPPASVVEGLRGLAEREAAPLPELRALLANMHDDYESVLTLIDALDAADSEEERAVAIAELRAYARRPEDIAPVEVMGPGVPLGPTKPKPFIGETPVREWVVGREPPPAREVVAPALVLGLTEVGRG